MECRFNWDKQPFIRKKRKKPIDNRYTIKFPSDEIRKQKFMSSEQVSIYLLKNALQIGLQKWYIFQKYKFQRETHNIILYSCKVKPCPAKLVFHQPIPPQSPQPTNPSHPSPLTPITISPCHSHTLPLTPKSLNQSQIRQYLFDLRPQQKIQNHLHLIKHKYNLSMVQVSSLKERVFWKFINDDHMLRKLSQRGVMFRRKKGDQGRAEVLVIVSGTMRKNYLLYGDNMSFDITYNLLMRKKDEKKHLGVGFFVGQDQNCRIVLFGMSTIQHQTSQNMKTMFQYFFDIMQYTPESIITDNQKTLTYSLQSLKEQHNYTYTHLLDWHHIMYSMRKTLKYEPNLQELVILINRAIKEPSRQVYRDIVLEIGELVNRTKVMDGFFRNQGRYSLGFVGAVFFGFGISSARAQAFNGLVKRSVPYQTNLGRLIYFILRIQKRLNNRSASVSHLHPALLSAIPSPQLHTLSEILQLNPAQQLRQYYLQSLQYTLILIPSSPTNAKIQYRKYQRQYTYNLMYDVECQCWRCECLGVFRTGLPCGHLMRIVGEFGGAFGYYASERWIGDGKNKGESKFGRPRFRDLRI